MVKDHHEGSRVVRDDHTKIYGPFTFAEEDINCTTYLDMFQFFFTHN